MTQSCKDIKPIPKKKLLESYVNHMTTTGFTHNDTVHNPLNARGSKGGFPRPNKET